MTVIGGAGVTSDPLIPTSIQSEAIILMVDATLCARLAHLLGLGSGYCRVSCRQGQVAVPSHLQPVRKNTDGRYAPGKIQNKVKSGKGLKEKVKREAAYGDLSVITCFDVALITIVEGPDQH